MTSIDPPVSADLSARLAAVEGVVFDVDGCLVLSDNPGGHEGMLLPGATEALRAIRGSGRRLVAFTNASSQTPRDLSKSLRDLGLDLAETDVLTPSVVAAEIIAERYPGQPVLAFGGPGLLDVLREADIALIDPAGRGPSARPAAVVIGWDTSFDRDSLQLAAEALWSGADFLVTSDARRFASRTKPMAGVGGFIARGLEYVTDRPYEVLGKPSAAAMSIACRHLGAEPAKVLVAGDDLSLEARMARTAGAVAVLVTTGMHKANDADTAPPTDRPDLVVSNLAQLMSVWRAADAVRGHPAA